MNLVILFPGLFTAIGKNLLGWIKNSVDKGSDLGTAISEYEWKKGVETLLVTLLIYFAGYFGFSALTDLNPELWASIAAFVVSSLWDSWKK